MDYHDNPIRKSSRFQANHSIYGYQKPGFWSFLKTDFWLIACITAIIAGWTVAYVIFFYQPNYQSSAKVIVKDSAITNRYIEPDSYYRLPTTSSNNANPVLNTLELLYGSDVSRSLYNYLRVQHPEELKKLEITNYRKWIEFYKDGKDFIKASNKAGTDVITVQLAWPNQNVAKYGLDHILEAFQDASRHLNSSEYTQRRNYLQKQINDMATQLLIVRNKKTGIKKNTLTVDVIQASANLEATRVELKNKINDVDSQRRARIAESSKYQKLLGMNASQALTASMIGQNPQLAALNTKLYELHNSYAQLNSFYTETNPNVQEVKSQITQVENDIEAELKRSLGSQYTTDSKKQALTTISDQNRATLAANLAASEAAAVGLQDQAQAMRSRLGEIEGTMRRTPEIAANLSNVEEEEATLSKALASLREKMAEFTLRETQTVSNVFVITPPAFPEKPQAPNEKHLLVFGLTAALVLGVSTAYLKNRFLSRKSTPRHFDDEQFHDVYADLEAAELYEDETHEVRGRSKHLG